ncbi:hypothetical protein GCM10017673_27770 [Streptosporangium violaceochromogenes]|nr:hypothetical protein GCM10017673_27770 [Streptosporangium violaceochromogenes]
MAPRKQEEIFQATLELLAGRGYEGLTVEGVAERSGVDETTIYRWWPSKAVLLGTALTESRLLFFETPDTGSLRGDLVALVEQVAGLLTRPPAADVAVAALGAAAGNPELAVGVQHFFADRFSRERLIFDRAVGRGELSPDADPMLIMDLLVGAIWLRAIFRGLPLDEDFAPRVVDAVL